MISRDVLVDVIEYWEEEISRAKVIQRDILDDIKKTMNMEEITVITGIRRSGKTYILYGLFKQHGGLYINFEDERLIDFSTEDFERIVSIAEERGTNILYFDEVQEVKGWEKFAHRAHRRFKIFVTGSNSKLLSSDYAQLLTGRTKTFVITPLTYKEFLRFRNLCANRKSLLEYMQTGGFPRIVLTGDLSLAREYFERIIYRDIIPRSDIRYPESLKDIALYLLSNVGKEFSYRSLSRITGIKHEVTLRNYVSLLRNAFLINIIPRYSPSIKKQESYGKKVYAMDPSFITLGKRISEDHGRILENIVFNHLSKRYKDIYYLKNEREADFIICESLKPRKVVNVVFDVKSDETLKREIASLRYYGKKYQVETELISLFPVSVPPEIKHRLAHHYLKEF